jgi:hypothetical protein
MMFLFLFLFYSYGGIPPLPSFYDVFVIRSHQLFPDWPQTQEPPLFISEVAGITGMHHHTPLEITFK